MRTIGALGGMTWHSTADYYRIINTRVREELGGAHSARVLISSVDQAEIEPMMESGRWDEAGARLAEDAAALERGGADVFILACNSLHTAWDAIVAPLTIPSIHIGDATAAAIPDGVDRVALLGTRYTMEGSFLRDRIEARGVAVVAPDERDRLEVHRAIFEELSNGIVRDETREWFTELVARLGLEVVVTGCGELAMLELDLPYSVDTATAHAEAAVAYALNDV
jgi:amino-acid racemase